MAILRPYLHSPGGSLLPPTPGPFRGPRGARLAPKRRRGEPASPMAIAIASPPSSRTDTGILAQQSDVRCKRRWLGVIMIAPAAHTSKGLAKAFVSSAGGKGPELLSLQTKKLPAPLSCAQRREVAPRTPARSGIGYKMSSGGEQLKGRTWRPPKTGLESRLESKLCARGLAGEVCAGSWWR